MDDKVFNLLEKMYLEMNDKFDKVHDELKSLKNQVTKIEIDHGKKLEILFDGHVQNTKLLEDIRDEVARHEEVIIKRVK